MTLVLHIFKKDLRHLRATLMVWFALLALFVIASVLQLRWIPDHLVAAELASLIRGGASAGIAVMSFVLFSRLMHNDPLTDDNAFWRTRPIASTTLFWAKLTFIIICIVVPGAIARLLWLAGAGVDARDLLLAFPEQLTFCALFAAFLMLAAGLTSSLSRMLVSLAGFGAVLALIVFNAGAIASPPALIEPAEPVFFHDATASIVASALWMVGIVAITWWLYRSRQRGMAMLLTGILIVITVSTPEWWPKSASILGIPHVDEAWATDPAITRLRLEPRVFRATASDQGRAYVSIAAHVSMAGLPANYTAIMPFRLSARADFDDGTQLASGRAYWHSERSETWPLLLSEPYDDLARLRGRAGRYTGTFRYTLQREDRVALLPMRAGEEYYEHSNGMRIVDVAPRDNGCRVVLKKTYVNLTALGPAPPSFNWHVVDRLGRGLIERPTRIGGTPDRHQFEWRTRDGERTLMVDYLAITPTFRDAADSGPRCEHLQLAVDRSQIAGQLTRTLDLLDFTIDEAMENLVTPGR